MGVTALVLLLVARLWLFFAPTSLLMLRWSSQDILLGLGLGLAITLASAIIYQLWPDYRRSADFYLKFVLKPLLLPDLLWMGLLPGLSEELLFSRCHAAFHRHEPGRYCGVELMFWRIAFERLTAMALRRLGHTSRISVRLQRLSHREFIGSYPGSYCD